MTAVAAMGRRGRWLLVPACLAAVVLGILGMHSLARHTEMPDHHQVAMTMTVVMDDPVIGPSGDQPMGDMVMLCSAMLLGAAAGLLLALRLGRLATHPAGQPVRGSLVHRPVTIRARAGPPYLLAFSVVRC